MFGAQVLVMSPERHDELVAVVSHVPHLTAATLMQVAANHAEQQRNLLRLAAGGFRDMTRVAAGQPSIWPAICTQNRKLCERVRRFAYRLAGYVKVAHRMSRRC